jgi:regulator of CtrA degradation
MKRKPVLILPLTSELGTLAGGAAVANTTQAPEADVSVNAPVTQNFSQLFRDGMKLVEETTAYLDGPGRQESKRLDRSASLGYAIESMRLTTRLMQLASWLLLHRAVNEGEMSLAQATKERVNFKLAAELHLEDTPVKLPERLSDLIARSKKLQDHVRRLDATIHAPIPSARRAAQRTGFDRARPSWGSW